jgi:hypothetical protein
LVLDLGALVSIRPVGLHTLERVARRSDPCASQLFIVNGQGPVVDAFETAGYGRSHRRPRPVELLDAGDGEWSPSLPPFPGRRAASDPSSPSDSSFP